MIERLVLKDFKSHVHSDIKFFPGLNIFLGEVGAGKTSILEAVSFALFGRYAANVKKKELIRRGAEAAEVQLVFSAKSGKYKVTRKVHPKKTQQAKLWIFTDGNWKLAVNGASVVSKSIEEILDVDSSTFLAAFYASQGEIKEMLETQPGNRRERLDKLLGIDMYERIWKAMGDAENLVLTELTKVQEKSGGVDVLEAQLEESKNRRKEAEEELWTLETLLVEIKNRQQPVEHQLQAFNELEKKASQFETQIEARNHEVENAQSTLESLKERIEKTVKAQGTYRENKASIKLEKALEKEKRRVETALQRKKNLETFLERDSVALEEAEQRLSKLKTQLNKLEALEKNLESLEKAKEALPKLREAQTEIEGKLGELTEETARASSNIENEEERTRRITELGECPTCLQTVPAEHKAKVKREMLETISELKANYAILEEARKKSQIRLGSLKKNIEIALDADKKHAQISGQVQMLTQTKEEIESVSARIDKIRSDISDYTARTAEIEETPETLLEIDEKLKYTIPKAELARDAEKQMTARAEFELMFIQEESNLKKLELNLEQLKLEREKVLEKYDAAEHGKIEQVFQALRADEARAHEGVERVTRLVHEEDSHMKRAEKQLEEKREAWKQAEELKAENNILEILRQSLRDVVQPLKRENKVSGVSRAFLNYYQELSNDNIDYAAIDEDGTIDVIRNGEPSPVNSLSGGETTCAALALRLAICSSLTKTQLLLLDEPTIHLDELYRAKLREFLGSHDFEHLIVVTHDNTFNSLPAHIFRVEKRMNRSLVLTSSLDGGT